MLIAVDEMLRRRGGVARLLGAGGGHRHLPAADHQLCAGGGRGAVSWWLLRADAAAPRYVGETLRRRWRTPSGVARYGVGADRRGKPGRCGAGGHHRPVRQGGAAGAIDEASPPQPSGWGWRSSCWSAILPARAGGAVVRRGRAAVRRSVVLVFGRSRRGRLVGLAANHILPPRAPRSICLQST